MTEECSARRVVEIPTTHREASSEDGRLQEINYRNMLHRVASVMSDSASKYKQVLTARLLPAPFYPSLRHYTRAVSQDDLVIEDNMFAF